MLFRLEFASEFFLIFCYLSFQTSDRHVIFSFNPINGKPSLPEHPQGQELPFTLKQATMQNIVDQEFMKVILLVDTENKVNQRYFFN